MADTVRSVSDLLTNLFQDGQTAGSVTPQDVRDLIVSLEAPHAEFHTNVAAETTIAAIDTFVKAAGSTTLFTSHLMDMPVDNRLRNISSVAARHFTVICSLSFTTAGNNKLIRFRLAKGGVSEAASEIRNKSATGSDEGTVTLITHMDLDENEFVELWLANGTDGTNITIERMTIIALGAFHFG